MRAVFLGSKEEDSGLLLPAAFFLPLSFFRFFPCVQVLVDGLVECVLDARCIFALERDLSLNPFDFPVQHFLVRIVVNMRVEPAIFQLVRRRLRGFVRNS